MLKKAVNIASVVLALSAVIAVMYSVQTSCPDAAIYVYCEKGFR